MVDSVPEDTEGKRVIDANGERVGTVESVEDGTPLVDPEPGINPTVTRALGWIDGRDVYPLRNATIETVTESAVHLRSNL